MPSIARIPITNVYMDGDYTGQILVGPHQKPMNVILDTGSSALALDGHKYQPDPADTHTNLAQTDSYGDGSSWTGAVIKTTIAVGTGPSVVPLNNANVAVAYDQSADMFRDADGILGLAYAPLDDAYDLGQDTWANQPSSNAVRLGKGEMIPPYLTQLASADVTSDIVSFYTKRSFIHMGAGGANDPLNQGWMIIGGGEEANDLYTGTFQSVKVLADAWYSTNLISVQVGNTPAIPVKVNGPKGMPSNSIIDSGTNTLNLSPQLLTAVFSRFSTAQQQMLHASVLEGRIVAASSLQLDQWPDLIFLLQGDAGNVSLHVKPGDYWQVNSPKVGGALAAFSKGEPGLAILGLPLMNGYFTIFDGEADGGKGAVKFATRK